jgi:23S rRNA pseudouridine1911/1915/1917 synthase
LSSIGHPLIGDDLYGGRLSKLDGLSRQFLHAKKIEVKLPDGTWIEAESQVPEDLRQVLITLNSKIVNQL